MITNSNPFLRNDYYPDQNDIDELNTRINEVQSDVDLLAISVNEKTEAVNGRLNNLQNDYNASFETEALKANTADLNVLNINVQATVKDLNAVNTYTENLIVNKPVQDLSLRTPHLENTTSLNGNFYAPNILGGELDNVEFKNIQNFNAVEVKANKLIGDFSAEPISSSAVVGYDENGQLIPVKASYDVSFPEDADYLKTDIQGVAKKGTSESEVVQSTNLIQAGAVQNMYDAVNANFNNVSNSFNAVNESFNNVNNTFVDYYTKTQADNKFVAQTEITQTLNSSETTVPSNKAVSDGLTAKVDKSNIVQTVDGPNSSASDKVPSCAAVEAYVAANIPTAPLPEALDITVSKDLSTSKLSVNNSTTGLCAVRVTKMSDGSTQYKSNINAMGKIANKQTAFTFNIETSAYYMIEAWSYNHSTQKLIPTAVKYV